MIAIIATALLGDHFLTAPIGVFAYLPAAAVFLCVGYLSGLFVLTWNTRLPPFGGSLVERLAIYGAIIVATAVSVVAVPTATFALEQRMFHSDPIGVGDDVARGPCGSRDVRSTPNGRDLVAVVRETVCAGNWDCDLMYFVFVHAPSVPNEKENLVFRYAADPQNKVKPPIVSWVRSDKLLVIAHYNIMQITYQVFDSEGLSVAYDLQSEGEKPTAVVHESVVR